MLLQSPPTPTDSAIDVQIYVSHHISPNFQLEKASTPFTGAREAEEGEGKKRKNSKNKLLPFIQHLSLTTPCT